MVRDLDVKKRKGYNYKRDLVLVVIALVVVAFYFQSENRFFLNPTKDKKTTVESHEKIYYAGPTIPEDLKLTAKMLAPVDRFAKVNGKHFKQIKIYIERQDSYGGIKDSTEVQFYTVTKFNDGTEIKSVNTPSTLKKLPARIARRLKDDMKNYFATKKKNRGTNIKDFTNTM